MDHHLQKKGLLNFVLIKLGIIEKPLSILYSYPAIVIGMIYVLLPFMIMSVYSSAEKLDWSYVEAARDLGASRLQAFFYHNTEAYTARAAFGCDPDFRAIHGTVLYCRYPGWK